MRLPESLIDSLENVPGFNRQTFLEVHESGEQLTSIRINPKKWIQPGTSIESHFITDPISQSQNLKISKFSQVPWCSNGYYLPERPSFTLDPLFHAGAYYVQEASSMFLEQAIKQTVDLSGTLKVLDLAAAPGGKSTLIQSLINSESILVSNEVIKSRVGVLQENMTKWGALNSLITNNDPKDFARLESYFDLMVVDAPCSGSGLFRKDISAISEWSRDNVILCSQRQKRILSDAWACLKENGILIYSTCSYSVEENENILDWIGENFKVETVRLGLDPGWRIIQTESPEKHFFGYRFYPDLTGGEGFFIAVLKKMDGDEAFPARRPSNTSGVSKTEDIIIKNWVKKDIELGFLKLKEQVIAIPPAIIDQISLLQKNLYVRQAGVLLGKLTSRELIPDHALALSELTNEKIVRITLNKDQALQYLRKAEVIVDTEHKGWALVEYKELNLGWIKCLSNRINNYYPKEWRILMR